MQERESYLQELQEMFWEQQQRAMQLEKVLTHTPGCIVRKRGRMYWQVRCGGKQVQRYVKGTEIEKVEERIWVMKQLQQRLEEQRQFLQELQGALRMFGLDGADVLRQYEAQRGQDGMLAEKQAAAQQEAAGKKYAANYKHLTDRGELVASKSEEMIANMLSARGIRYEYEREMMVAGVSLKPDFVIWRADGSMVIWEHAGLLDDVKYRKNFERKMELYRQEGFTQMKNLIVTYDENGAFSMRAVRRMITAYGL